MYGAFGGAVTGGLSKTVQVSKAASAWEKGTYKSGLQSMSRHYQKHAVKEGFSRGNNVVKYTNDALSFAEQNSSKLRYTPPSKAWLTEPTWYFKSGSGGRFSSSGKIYSFWYD